MIGAIATHRAEASSAEHGSSRFVYADTPFLIYWEITRACDPSGFLPLAAGNVRAAHIVQIYRESELFRTIRQTSRFKGRCGFCEFKEICGGSRARAYAAYGDCLAEDPACSYRPRRYCG